jgi:hypothetical protein
MSVLIENDELLFDGDDFDGEIDQSIIEFAQYDNIFDDDINNPDNSSLPNDNNSVNNNGGVNIYSFEILTITILIDNSIDNITYNIDKKRVFDEFREVGNFGGCFFIIIKF